MASFTTTQSESETKEATLQNDIDLAIQDVMYLPKTGPTSLTSRLSIAGVKSDDILTSTLEDINIRFALAPKLTPILYSNIRKALLRNRIEVSIFYFDYPISQHHNDINFEYSLFKSKTLFFRFICFICFWLVEYLSSFTFDWSITKLPPDSASFLRIQTNVA